MFDRRGEARWRGRTLASLPGCDLKIGGFRGYRCAQPPATICHPSGMGIAMPQLDELALSLQSGIRQPEGLTTLMAAA